MKKFICVVLVFFMHCVILSADDWEGEFPNKFVLDAGFTWVNNPSLVGGHFDFGIVIYKNILYIQNNFLLRAGGINVENTKYSVFTLSEKLIFGRNSATPLSIYTYLEGGIGIYGNDEKKIFTTPMAYSFGFGGGGEIASEDFGGIYVEVGYLGQKVDVQYPLGGVILQTGMRIFF
jgi:hypothetical protein